MYIKITYTYCNSLTHKHVRSILLTFVINNNFHADEHSTDASTPVIAVVAIVAGLALIVLVVLVAIVIWRKMRRNGKLRM